MALVLAPSIEGPPSIDGLIAGAVIHVAAAGIEAVGALGQITQQAVKQAGSALGDLTAQAWGAINNAFVQSPGYVFPDGTFNENGFVAAPSGPGRFSYSWKLVGDPMLDGDSWPGVRIITVQRIPLLLNQYPPYYWGEGINVYGYDLNGTIISSVALRRGWGGGQLVFDAGPEPQVKLEYLKFIWVPETGAAVEVEAQPFVGSPPRTKSVPLPKAKVAPAVSAAVASLPEPPDRKKLVLVDQDVLPTNTPAPNSFPAYTPIPLPTTPLPTTPTTPLPVKTTPTQPDGTPSPVTAAKPTTTPTDAHVVDNKVIPANGPQPSLDGIAKEVGRIESKMASVMKSTAAKDGPEWDEILGVLRFLKAIFDGITDDEPQSAYQISSPCELDDQEQRIVFASTIAASTDKFGAIINRINAVADLLQHSKNLKQPLCPGQRFPVSGQAVTVNFTQID